MPTSRFHFTHWGSGLLLLVWVLVLLSGCGGSSGHGPAHDTVAIRLDQWPTTGGALSTVRTGCDVLAGASQPGGTFVFALTDPVLPTHAPVPRNRSERVVFAQLYETLVDVDCEGTVVPGLAAKWTCTEDSTTWVFTLREDARFWDGTRITAADVRRSWAANQSDRVTPGGASPWNWINARAASITAVDARRLAIQLPEPQARFPLLLAHPAAAVAIRQPGWIWPVGSGPCRLRASDPAPRPDLSCRPNPEHPTQPHWKSLVFRVMPDTDPRDLVATDFDLALVEHLDTVGFFAEAPGFSTHALPWNRLYLLVCPPDLNPAGTTRWTAAVAGLKPARDVTTISARGWNHIMFPVGSAGICPQLSGPITNRQAAPLTSHLADSHLDAGTIAYAAGDPGAAALAARLSHLAGTDTRVCGLSTGDLDLALQWQMAGAFVIAQDQLFATGCLQLAALLGHAAWLQQAGLARPAPGPAENLAQADDLAALTTGDPAVALAEAGIVHPLALGHGWLVTRGEIAGLQLDFDGTPLLSGLGRAAAAEVRP